MKAIQLDALKAISTSKTRSEEREKITVSWKQQNENGDVEEQQGDFYLIKSLSYGAQLRLITAGSITDQTVALLVERVRFGEAGEDRLTYEQARDLVETQSPLIAAVCNAAWSRLKDFKEADGEGENQAKS